MNYRHLRHASRPCVKTSQDNSRICETRAFAAILISTAIWAGLVGALVLL